MPGAPGAQPAEGQVMRVDNKPGPAFDGPAEGPQQTRIHLHFPAALAADKVGVGVLGIAHRETQRFAAAGVQVEQAGAAQRLQRSVDGGRVESRQAAAGIVEDLLGGAVIAGVCDRFKDHRPLGGHPVARPAQLGGQAFAAGHMQLLVVANYRN
jgi:hypothetical protein